MTGGDECQISQLSAKLEEPNDELRRVESQHADGATVSVDIKSAACWTELFAKCAKVA